LSLLIRMVPPFPLPLLEGLIGIKISFLSSFYKEGFRLYLGLCYFDLGCLKELNYSMSFVFRCGGEPIILYPKFELEGYVVESMPSFCSEACLLSLALDPLTKLLYLYLIFSFAYSG
jgi:hypothetical protein